MAVYEYLCGECGLKFETRKPMSRSAEPEACPECGATAQKLVSQVSHTFAHQPVGGPRPQNTGVHAIDYSYDRVIGRDAEAKWKVIQERQRHKVGVIRDNPGATGHDLSRTHDGDYRVMKPEERAASERGRALHREAMKAVEASKNPKANGG